LKNSSAFWDASALVPLCVNQAASGQARSYLRKFAVVVWWGSFVEVHGAFCRLHRQSQISDLTKQHAWEHLRSLRRGWREVVPDESVRDLAVRSLDTYSLRAADSLQLAAALVWCAERAARRTFICADQRLAQAAKSAGFSVVELFPPAP